MTAERAAFGTPIARAVPKGRAGSCPAGRKARWPWVRRHRSGTHYLSDWAVPPVVHLLRRALPFAENSAITASAGRQTKPSLLTIVWNGEASKATPWAGGAGRRLRRSRPTRPSCVSWRAVEIGPVRHPARSRRLRARVSARRRPDVRARSYGWLRSMDASKFM